MKTFTRLTITIFLLCASLTSNSQVPSIFFSDTLTKLSPWQALETKVSNGAFYTYGKSYIYSASGLNKEINVLIKTDTANNHLWTAYPYNYSFDDSLNFNAGYRTDDLQMLLTPDPGIYFLNTADSPFYPNSGGSVQHISRIDDATGEVKWMSKVNTYDLDKRYVRINDYSTTELLYASFRLSSNQYVINKILKSTGALIQSKNYPVGPQNFENAVGYEGPTRELFVSQAKSLFIFTADTCYKYTSFENQTLEWKVPFGSFHYADIQNAYEDNGMLFICGSKQGGFESGLITSINMINGVANWQTSHYYDGPPATAADFIFADAKIKGNYIYATWLNRYVGSITERTFISCTNKNTGAIVWRNNYDFNADTTTGGKPQSMLSLDIDNNSTIYLTGRVPHPLFEQTDWGVMKINGNNGLLISKKRIPKIVTPQYSDDIGQVIKLYGSKLYLLGSRTNDRTIIEGKLINIIRMDTSNLSVNSIGDLKALIQYPSVTAGLRDFSTGKRVIVKNVGKSLVVELTDRNFNSIWKKTLGNSTDYYKGTDAIGTNLSKRIFVAAKRYKTISGWMLNEYHAPDRAIDNDSTFVFELDSLGTLIRTKSYLDNDQITPLRFVVDTISTRTFYQFTSRNPASTAIDFYDYSFTAYDGTYGTSWGTNIGREPFLKQRNMYHLSTDSLISFQTSTFGVAKIIKTKYLGTFTNIFYTLPKVRVVYDVEKNGKDFYLAGQDSLKNDFISYINANTASEQWRNTYDSFQNTLKVLHINNALFTLVKRGKNYSINKYSKTTGAIIWTRAINVLANHSLQVNDVVPNLIKKTITVTGSITDSTGPTHESKYFAWTLDDQDNETFRNVTDGDRLWQTAGTCLYVDKDARTIAGGRINHGTDGYAGFITDVTGITVIPVTLTKFSGTEKNAMGFLTWSTQSEINSGYYIIERSNDPIHFSAIGQVTSANSSAGSLYNFTDRNPMAGINYYRLKMLDIDGHYTYSNIISLTFGKNNFQVYPNPVKDVLNILCNGEKKFQVIDSKGAVLMKFTVNNSITMKIKLPNGTYYLKEMSSGQTNIISIAK